MNRRQFGVGMAAFGLPAEVWAERKTEVEKIQLSRNGWMPNNDRLPVLLYRRAFDGAGMADQMEAALEKNLWPAQWRNGVYNLSPLPLHGSRSPWLCRRQSATDAGWREWRCGHR